MFQLPLPASFESMLWVYVYMNISHFQYVFRRQNLLSIEGPRAERVRHINVKFVNHQMMSEDTDLFCINYVDISSSLMCDLSNNRYWAFDVLRGSTDAIIFQKSNKLLLLWRYMLGSKLYKSQVIFSHLNLWVASAKHNFNPFKPDFTIVIFIHYKPRIAVAILHL